MDAPTAEFILGAGASFAVHCHACKLMTVPPDLAARLCAAGKGAIPADQLKFRCQRCGKPGEPWVTGEGNSLIGRPHLWPPKGTRWPNRW